MLIQEFYFNSMLRKIVSGDMFPGPEIFRVASRQQGLAVLFLIFFVISMVTFILWFRRAYYNLNLLIDGTAHNESWAAGAWFVPIIGLYRPYEIMKELYVKSETYLKEHSPDYIPWLKTSNVGWWWGFWMLSNVIGQISIRLTLKADTPTELLTASNIALVDRPVSIILSLITIRVMRDYASTEPFLEQVIPVPQFPPLPGMEETPSVS